jgi:N-acetylneuraminic acid mutarotase
MNWLLSKIPYFYGLLLISVVLPGVQLKAGSIPNLPEAVTSFGACKLGSFVYVYGGHVGEAHVYSEETYSRSFIRYNLKAGKKWERLPFNQPLQGFGMAAHKGKIYLAGGSHATNEKGKKSNLSSLADVSVFDVKTKKWSKVTPLPEPRSSHELVAYKGKLYVIGGWNMKDGKGVNWHFNGLVADLAEDPIRWKKLPTTDWKVRANSAAVVKNQLYVIGGLNDQGTTGAVKRLNLKSFKWYNMPEFPSPNRIKGFGSSACNLNGKLVAGGFSYQPHIFLDSNSSWIPSPEKVKEKRFFHRMVPLSNEKVLFIGGANFEGHLDDIEILDFSEDKHGSFEEGAQDFFEKNKGEVWTGFRGDGNSQSFAVNLPLEWSDEKNLLWRSTLAGYGQSTPVVWGDFVFTTSTEGNFSEQLMVQCTHLVSGELIWEKSFPTPVKIERSQYVSQAAPSPVVDESGVYLFFESGLLLALDHKGNKLWDRTLTKEYGPIEGNHGVGSSLFQSAKSLGLLVDHSGPSYLIKIDKQTGRNDWKMDRPKRVSWSTPTLSKTSTNPTVFISSNGVVEAIDFEKGEKIWEKEGIEGNTVASPTLTDQLVIIGSSAKDQSLALNRSRETLDNRIVWIAENATSSFGSPLVAGGNLYLVNRAGVATCHDLNNGSKKWDLRLPGSCWASPISSAGRVYFFTKDGDTIVIKNDGSKEILSRNKLSINGRVYGVASVENSFVFRTGSELICVSKII